MKFMAHWKVRSGSTVAVSKAFLKTGAGAPEGLTILGRWHAPGSNFGWALSEGSIDALAEHMALWGEHLDLTITPVIEDEQAGAALGKVYG